uniref:Chromosome 9 C8orf74 homolog n=1 Tax=Astyanax mexicanus TaxID=7994 RepID=A0A3B1JT39_ASTMX
MTRDEGIQRLSFCFQWREFEGDEQRQYLHQEFVYENVMYSVKRGLPWSSVAQVASMTKELLPELKGLERSEVISLIRTRLSQHQLQLSPAHRAVLYDFILEIHIPPHPPPLCEGTDVVVWEKQQALRELTAAEAEKQSELQRLREQAETELMAKLQERLGDLLVENRLDRQEVQTTVRTFLQSQGEFFKDNLEKEIRTVQELLEIKMRQKSLLGRGPSSNTSSFSEKLSVPSSTKVKKSKK